MAFAYDEKNIGGKTIVTVSIIHQRPIFRGVLEHVGVVDEVGAVGAALHAQGAAGDPAVGVGDVGRRARVGGV